MLTPSYSALFTCGTGLISLTLDTKIHDVVSADRTVVNNDICNQNKDQSINKTLNLTKN
jgi:hypothetical protein